MRSFWLNLECTVEIGYHNIDGINESVDNYDDVDDFV